VPKLCWAFLLVSIAAQSLLGAVAIGEGERMNLVSGYPIVEALVNGHGPFRMLVDTGAARCALRPAVAVQIGLVARRELVLTTFTGEQLAPEAEAAIQVGPVEEQKTEILIHDLPGLEKLPSRVDGLLGQSFLRRHPYLIDFKSNRLLLGVQAEAKSLALGGPVQVQWSYGRPMASVTIGPEHEQFYLILDSGVDRLILRCLRHCPALSDEETVTGFTNTGKAALHGGHLRAVRIGGSQLFGVPAATMEAAWDPEDAAGSIPLRWFAAIYVDTARGFVRFAQRR